MDDAKGCMPGFVSPFLASLQKKEVSHTIPEAQIVSSNIDSVKQILTVDKEDSDYKVFLNRVGKFFCIETYDQRFFIVDFCLDTNAHCFYDGDWECEIESMVAHFGSKKINFLMMAERIPDLKDTDHIICANGHVYSWNHYAEGWVCANGTFY